METFFWYDYETFGRDKHRCRVAQFAGIRTDRKLRPVEEPIVLFCKPSPDYLPSPESCLVHGLTPQYCDEHGLIENEFVERIHRELSRPETCSAGYNALNFDHIVSRFLFYRNLRDPYKWQYEAGNSRWDIIDLARAAYALRPEGIDWPTDEEGRPSFQLGQLADANGIDLTNAHDALADVEATIELAKLLKKQQPRLFDYYLTLRDKHRVANVIDTDGGTPFVCTSGMIPADRACTSLFTAIGWHPRNTRGEIVVWDLRDDPSPFLDMSGDELRELMYTKNDDLPDEIDRPPLTSIRTNSIPFVAPGTTLKEDGMDRARIDPGAVKCHLAMVREHPEFSRQAIAAFDSEYESTDTDVEVRLYDQFIPNSDRWKLDTIVRELDPAVLEDPGLFDDPRLPELTFRFFGRSYPDRLPETWKDRWYDHCRMMLRSSESDTGLEAFEAELERVRSQHGEDPRNSVLLDELETYKEALLDTLERHVGTG